MKWPSNSSRGSWTAIGIWGGRVGKEPSIAFKKLAAVLEKLLGQLDRAGEALASKGGFETHKLRGGAGGRVGGAEVGAGRGEGADWEAAGGA